MCFMLMLLITTTLSFGQEDGDKFMGIYLINQDFNQADECIQERGFSMVNLFSQYGLTRYTKNKECHKIELYVYRRLIDNYVYIVNYDAEFEYFEMAKKSFDESHKNMSYFLGKPKLIDINKSKKLKYINNGHTKVNQIIWETETQIVRLELFIDEVGKGYLNIWFTNKSILGDIF